MLHLMALARTLLFAVFFAGSVLSPALPARAASQASPAAGETACPETTLDENKALVQRYYDEVFNQGDLAVLDDVLSADFHFHGGSRPEPVERGPAADAERVLARQEEFPDRQVVVELMVAEGDHVMARLHWSGTNLGPFPDLGAPATDRRAEWNAVSTFRIECGQLAEQWLVTDYLTRLRQLGIITDDELATVGTPTVATPVP